MIRKIKTTDYPILMEIWESAVRNTHDFLLQSDFEYYLQNIPTYFQYVELIGFENSQKELVGFMGTAEDSLEMLFIHNDYRGKGIGKCLLTHAIDKLNIKRVDVNEQNIQALDFYLHFGFKQLGRSETDGQGKAYPILHLSL